MTASKAHSPHLMRRCPQRSMQISKNRLGWNENGMRLDMQSTRRRPQLAWRFGFKGLAIQAAWPPNPPCLHTPSGGSVLSELSL